MIDLYPDPLSRQLADAGAAIARRQASREPLTSAEARDLLAWLTETLASIRLFSEAIEKASAGIGIAYVGAHGVMAETVAQAAAATVLYHRLSDMETPTDARIVRLDPAARTAPARTAGGAGA